MSDSTLPLQITYRAQRSTWWWFALVALVGTATTALNTAIPMFMSPPPQGVEAQAVLRVDPLYMLREWTLLLHAVATMIAPLGLALLLLQHKPVLAIVAFLFTFIEKLTELFGQTVRVFTVNGVWRKQILESTVPEVKAHAMSSIQFFSTIWNDMFFILWTCGALAALLFAIAAIGRSRLSNAFSVVAALVFLLALPSVASDYLGYRGSTFQSPLLYALVMTSHRALIAALLIQAAANVNRAKT
jgi:hypothetical protein